MDSSTLHPLPASNEFAGNKALDVQDAENMGTDEEPEPGEQLAGRLADAKESVEQLEALGAPARAALPDYRERVEAARALRDRLQRERRAERPVQWRLVRAKRRAADKQAACARASADLQALQDRAAAEARAAQAAAEKIAEEIAEQRLVLQRAQEEDRLARQSLAAVQAEIAREVPSPAGEQGGPQCGPAMGPQGVDPASAIAEARDGGAGRGLPGDGWRTRGGAEGLFGDAGHVDGPHGSAG